MKKLNNLSPLLLILILTVETLSFARNYQVARVQGVITKIRGRRVRVQDNKNQIYWVDRQDVIPRSSQIYDKVNFYKKVRFKSSYTPKTTSFLLKHRKKKMLKALRNFVVNHEKQYAYRMSVKKRTTSVIERIKSFLKIEKAHAMPSPISEDNCYLGGWKGKYSRTSNFCYIGHVADKSSCGDKDDNGSSKGFRCNPDLFPAETNQPEKPIYSIKDDNVQENGICIKVGKNLTQRCYAAYREISRGNNALVKKNVINDLAKDYMRAGKIEELQASFDEILKTCSDNTPTNSNGIPALGACYTLTQELNEIANEVIGQKKERVAERQELINEVSRIAKQQIEQIMKTYQSQVAPIYVNPQYQQQQQQPSYRIIGGNGGVQPGLIQSAISQYARPGQPLVIIVIPGNGTGAGAGQNTVPVGISNQLAQIIEQNRILNERLAQLQQQQQTNPTEVTEVTEEINENQERINFFENLEVSNYAYSNDLEKCKELSDNGGPQLCLVKSGDLYTAYSKSDSGYKEVANKVKITPQGSILVDGNLVDISELAINTDPDLNWSCEVFKDTDSPACPIDSTEVAVMHTSCEESESGFKIVGYLSPKNALAMKPLLGDSERASFKYSFNGLSKKTEITQPQDLVLDFDKARSPQAYVNKCANDDEQLSIVDFNKSCLLDEGFTPINCPHCTPKEAPQKTQCVANLKCEAVYKDSYNRQATGSDFEFKAICDCEITADQEGIVSDTNSCHLPINNFVEPEPTLPGDNLGADDTVPTSMEF